MNNATKNTSSRLLLAGIMLPLLWLLMCGNAMAQKADYSKMSGLVREAARSASRICAVSDASAKKSPAMPAGGSICAFVKAAGEEPMRETGCRILARFGDIYIADIPLRSIATLSMRKEVLRIEASQGRDITMDTTRVVVGADKIFLGDALPQAFTGKGVVVGSMDVGYDLTNPNFYDRLLASTRIRRFWDQLSADSIGSGMYVGADYRTEADILSYAHSRDAEIQAHGTHTLGIAAGTGFDTPYRGMAPDADICLVSNAVNSDISLIPEGRKYRYTSAADALGFKYIFDYAQEVGKPCVITFSEGAIQTLDADEQLYEQVISQLTGPGRILVASAGNRGYLNTYKHKAAGTLSDGVFVSSPSGNDYMSLVSDMPFSIRLTFYQTDAGNLEKSYTTAQITAAPDSLLEDTIEVNGEKFMVGIEAYKPFHNPTATVYQMKIEGARYYGLFSPISVEAVGEDADVDMFSDGIRFDTNVRNPSLGGVEKTRNILSPGSASSVICVGATSYRDHIVDENGNVINDDWGREGGLAVYSSVGPTRDGLVKPDVVAPGTHVNSSFSSFFPQDDPNNEFVRLVVARSDFNGRRYPWGALKGTSMSTPVVAGAIALWLQAAPTLTTERCMDIFAETCRRRDGKAQGEKDCLYGYGEIDAYAGLLKVLGIDGIKGLSKSAPEALSIGLVAGNTLRIAAYGETSANGISVVLYSLKGEKVMERRVELSDGKAELSLASLAPGVYAVQVTSTSRRHTGSTLVRVAHSNF